MPEVNLNVTSVQTTNVATVKTRADAISFGQDIFKENIKMTNTIEMLKIRIHKLQQKDPVVNNTIIRKLQRRVRALEGK